MTRAAYTMYNLPTFRFMCGTPSEARVKLVWFDIFTLTAQHSLEIGTQTTHGATNSQLLYHPLPDDID